MPMVSHVTRIVIVFLMFLGVVGPLIADTLPENFVKHERVLVKASKALGVITKNVDQETLSDAVLVKSQKDAEAIRAQLGVMQKELTPKYEALQGQVEALNAPVNGADKKAEGKEGDSANEKKTEAAKDTKTDDKTAAGAIDAANKKLAGKLSGATLFMKRLGVLEVQSQQLITKIQAKRRALFTNQLFKRHKGPLTGGFWSNMGYEINRLKSDALLSLNSSGAKSSLYSTIIAGAAFLGVWLLSLLILPRFFATRMKRDDQAYLMQHGAFISIGRLIAHLGAPVIAAAALLWGTSEFLPSSSHVGQHIWRFLYALVITIGLYQLSRALFLPYPPAPALLTPPRKNGKAIHRLLTFGALIYGVYLIGKNIFDARSFSVNLTILHACFVIGSFVLIYLALARCAKRVPAVQLVEAHDGATSVQATGQATQDKKVFGVKVWTFLRVLWLLSALVASCAMILGYFVLGVYIVIQAAHITFIAGLYSLLSRAIVDLRRDLGGTDTLLGGHVAQRFRVEEQRQTVFAFWVSFLLQTVLAVASLVALAFLFGVEWNDIAAWFKKIFFEMKSGSLDLSLSSIAIAIGLFLVGLFITRNIQHWFGNSFASHANLQADVRDSMRTGIGYLGTILAILVGVSYIGLDFTNLAIVAGALSVGIGFGLQSIVNNFVSGLILLIERPVKVGDWIYVGEHNGRVQNISVRSTEIETFDQSTVIIPNSELIMGRILNWNHGSSRGRLKIAVGVGYDSDAEQVKKLLLEVADEHPACLKHPTPDVLFTDFGASSLDFELRSYIRNIQDVVAMRSELRFKILEKLRANNIEIPFPQRDVHIIQPKETGPVI